MQFIKAHLFFKRKKKKKGRSLKIVLKGTAFQMNYC